MTLPMSTVVAVTTLIMFAQSAYAQISSPASGQAYPSKPVRVILGLAPGGGADIVARATAQKLGESFGQSFVVDNRPGAGGAVAGALTARAPADGYTIMLVSASFGIAAVLHDKLPYDAVKDFAPIILIATSPQVLVVHPSVPARTVKELVALAKARPGKLNYGSSGVGGSIHLAGELFKLTAGVDIVHIPYKGSGPALTDLIGGQVDLVFSGIISVVPHVKSKRVRALAVTSARRSKVLPDIPTLAEDGLIGSDAVSWYGLVAPAATPHDIVARLNSEMSRALVSPEFRARLAADGAEEAGGAPDQLAAHIQAEIAKWTRVVQQAKIRME